MPRITETPTQVGFTQGLADNPNSATLSDGELQLAKGVEYRLGEASLFKQPGRTVATTLDLGVAILGIKRFQYNGFANVLVAVGDDGHIYEATPGTSMAFSDVMLTTEFEGSGLNNLTVGGTFTDTNFSVFEAIISGVGTGAGGVDQYKWRKDYGAWSSAVDMTGSPQSLSDGVTITWEIQTTGHTIDDNWYITAIPTLDTSAQPQFTTYNSRWLLSNGVDGTLLREPEQCPGTGGKWRPATLNRPSGKPTVTNLTSTVTAASPDANSGDALFADWSVDQKLETRALMTQPNGGVAQAHTWSFTTNLVGTNRGIYITHSGNSASTVWASEPEKPKGFLESLIPTFNPWEEEVVIPRTRVNYWYEYRWGGSGDWTIFWNTWNKTGYSRTDTFFPIDDSVDFSVTPLEIRANVSVSTGSWGAMNINEVVMRSGRATATNVLYGITYGITEVYIDSQGVEHETAISQISDIFSPGSEVDTYGASIDLSTIVTDNAYAPKWRLYRSLDSQDGGFPYMYRINEFNKESISYVDTFEDGLTAALNKYIAYDFVTVTFADGATFPFDSHTPLPLTKCMVPFQGSFAVLPADDAAQDLLYYTLPYSISPSNGVFVPSIYYLRFDTKNNDDLTSMVVCNGGRSLIVYTQSQAHLVNYLPQASDPGRFDQRAKEKVSSSRGCSGKLAACAFSPDDGVTEYAAAIDTIGLWITDGVGILKNWSKDLDWDQHFSSANLNTAQLIDNPEKRRLELLYDSTGSGAWKRLLFFYGTMKQNGQPKITGPDALGIRCLDYVVSDSDWVGWSGDSSSTGKIFNEETGTADASEGNGIDDKILYDVQTKEFYPYQLKDSGLIMFLYLKWDNPSTSKEVSTVVTTRVERNQKTLTSTRDYNVKLSGKMLVRKYGTSANIRITDNTNTALPGLVAAQILSRMLEGDGDDTPATVP